MLLTMTTENLVNCHCQLSITIGHGVKVVKVKVVKVGFALQLLQLQLEKHGVEVVCRLMDELSMIITQTHTAKWQY